jgi:flagellar motor switch/type III secretory pathway protein FliN
MSRLLTPAEVEALRSADRFVPAPTETFHVTVEAGTAAIAPDALASLQPGSVIPLQAAKPGLVAIVANAVIVGHGRLEERQGTLAVRVVSLALPRKGGRR